MMADEPIETMPEDTPPTSGVFVDHDELTLTPEDVESGELEGTSAVDVVEDPDGAVEVLS
jgi:hypothetical protein